MKTLMLLLFVVSCAPPEPYHSIVKPEVEPEYIFLVSTNSETNEAEIVWANRGWKDNLSIERMYPSRISALLALAAFRTDLELARGLRREREKILNAWVVTDTVRVKP